MRENVRAKEKWFNPGGRKRHDCREPNLELRGTDKRQLSRMLVIARRDQRNRANVVGAIRIGVNPRVQLRRSASDKCPGEGCENNGRYKNAQAIL